MPISNIFSKTLIVIKINSEDFLSFDEHKTLSRLDKYFPVLSDAIEALVVNSLARFEARFECMV